MPSWPGATALVTVNHRTAEQVCELLTRDLLSNVSVAIVVDNTEDNEELARLTARLGEVEKVQIHTTANLGYGAAVNTGAKAAVAAGCEFLLVMNPDTHLLTTWFIQDAISAIRDGFAIVTPAIVSGPAAGPYCYWFDGGEIDLNRGVTPHVRWGQPFPAVPRDGIITPSEFATGGAMMISCETFQRIGGFREDLFMYWEDVDLSLRSRSQGLRIGHIRSSAVWHEVGGAQTGAGKSPLYHYYFNRNRLLVCDDAGLPALQAIFGSGMSQSIYLLWRAIREPERRLQCLAAAIRGMAAGLRNSSRRSI